jgi:hypothetical protein
MARKNEALFKPFLFADQDLDALVADLAPPPGALAEAKSRLDAGDPGEAEVVLTAAMLTRPDEVGAWHRLALAAAQVRRGNRAAATRTLRTLADASGESRIRLWAWTALRGLGVAPPPDVADRVEGVVAEVEGGHGVETLAAYADGSARYLLANGAKVIWDAPDDRLARAVTGVIAAAERSVAATAPGRRPGEPGPGMARLTVLTPAGARASEESLADAAADSSPRAALFGAVTELLKQVLALAKW